MEATVSLAMPQTSPCMRETLTLTGVDPRALAHVNLCRRRRHSTRELSLGTVDRRELTASERARRREGSEGRNRERKVSQVCIRDTGTQVVTHSQLTCKEMQISCQSNSCRLQGTMFKFSTNMYNKELLHMSPISATCTMGIFHDIMNACEVTTFNQSREV